MGHDRSVWRLCRVYFVWGARSLLIVSTLDSADKVAGGLLQALLLMRSVCLIRASLSLL